MRAAHRLGARTPLARWRRARVRLAAATGAISLCVLMTSCAGAVHGVSSPGAPGFPGTAHGDARFIQWVLGNSGRRVRLVDVTASYPDPRHAVTGAIVLVGKKPVPYRPNDYTHRPVVVRYASPKAAQAATRGHDPRMYGRRGPTVLWIPATLPPRVAAEYRFAGSAGLA